MEKNGITTPAHTYVRLAQGVSPSAIEQKIPNLLTKYLGENRGEQKSTKNTYYLQPLKRIHLYSGFDYGYHQGGRGDIYDLYLLIIIAAFILIIACINFMNLATARATNRMREIGMRKVLGANRSQLIIQFLGESVLLSCFAVIIALLITALILPYFTAFVGRSLSLNLFSNISVGIWLIGIALCVGILSGSYPAFFLSGFKPVVVLKGILKIGPSGIWIRKLLVVSQFAIAALLIISTIIVYQQLRFMKNKNLGFDKEQVLVMPIFDNTQLMKVEKSALSNKYNTVKQEFLTHPNILIATASRGIPGGLRGGSYMPTLRTEEGREIEVRLFDVDEDFIGLFDFRLIAGRAFSGEDMRAWNTASEKSYIITETTARHLGWADPVGKSLAGRGHLSRGQVVGMIEDFHLDLRHSLGPIVLTPSLVRLRYLSLKVHTEDLPETMDFLKKTWHRFVPDRPFDYFFLDERIDALYKQEIRHGQIFGIGACFAIFVACLGLLGMASFTAEQRTKEISIRKVLGASV
ncbi:MAG: FtsX-like permease family protein, partial [Candidatus Poribacteria bacterium]|nr:FtsX-like permease family protein [Candidatus Poribacteria bacterium]